MTTSTKEALATFLEACDNARKTRGTAEREALARAFETALVAVFDEAKPQHGLNAKYVRYRQMLHAYTLLSSSMVARYMTWRTFPICNWSASPVCATVNECGPVSNYKVSTLKVQKPGDNPRLLPHPTSTN
jgi:hypothetical protein